MMLLMEQLRSLELHCGDEGSRSGRLDEKICFPENSTSINVLERCDPASYSQQKLLSNSTLSDWIGLITSFGGPNSSTPAYSGVPVT
jgi:hypothetical protein